SNYNNFYSSGSNLVDWNGTNFSSVSAFYSASGLDANSINTDPIYVSNTDLHATANAINNLGTPIASVTTDIDGQARSISTPDIGADEFTPVGTDAGIVSITNPTGI